ncbi:hypothetical protein EYF80_029092 [Liparis tanakae]|uniref:Uncharacterized protein n=1 Tax=Liparis tanakae TaxID=230148 RepID=A0A4Z2H4H1_9TELE|nr:hypothetical protein EYF80_029092 [Liparis tanakae]
MEDVDIEAFPDVIRCVCGGSEVRGQDYLPRQTTPSPLYPSRQVQVLSPAETLKQVENSEHPPFALLHRSISETQREGITYTVHMEKSTDNQSSHAVPWKPSKQRHSPLPWFPS